MPHITFIHGIANKPDASSLLTQWRRSLAQDVLGHDDGLDLGAAGITSSLIYWADVLYDQPLAAELAAAEEALREDGAVTGEAAPAADPTWRAQLPANEQRVVAALEAKLTVSLAEEYELATPSLSTNANLERIPLPWVLKRRLMEQFLRDVHHYLFNVRYSPRPGDTYQVQDVIRERVVAALQEGAQQPGPHLLVSHSMGTVIAYDCLTRVASCPVVDGLMTIGSPLGIDEVQDQLCPVGTTGRFPAANAFPKRVTGSWVNVYDLLDPVTGLDGDIANDFLRQGSPAITVIREANWGTWRHDIDKYLAGPRLRAALREQLGL